MSNVTLDHRTTKANFATLARAVVRSSVSKAWSAAVTEWEVVALEEDLDALGVCVCGQTGLVKLFTIRNKRNDSVLFPIGSVCVNQFGRKDLDQQITVFSDLLTLRSAVIAGERVTLTAQFFSRAVLEWFYAQGVFTPDHWNRGDGANDYDFLLKMFNKRDKDSISRAQRQKLSLLLRQKVFPFIQADDRLK